MTARASVLKTLQTPRQPAKKTAAESQEIQGALFDNHPVPTWIYDRESLALLELSAAAAKTHGYSRGRRLKMNPAAPHHEVPSRHLLDDGHVMEAEVTSPQMKSRAAKRRIGKRRGLSRTQSLRARQNGAGDAAATGWRK